MSLNVAVVGGRPSITYTMNSTDAAQIIAVAKQTQGSGDKLQTCKSAMITVEDNEIRYTFGVTPVKDGASELGHPGGDGSLIKLNSLKSVRDFQFISAIAGSHAKLMITIGF